MKKFFTEKHRRQMKVCLTLGIFLFLVNGTSFASNDDSQLLDKEISITLREVSFEQMLTELSAIAKVKFAYSVDQLDIKEPVSIHAEKRTLRDILDELLTPRNIKYKVHEVESTISLKRTTEKVDKNQSVLQDELKRIRNEKVLIQITGTVTDMNSQPMPGVNIVAKGSTNGTSSDAEGKYAINVEEKDVLVFSFIGYASQEIVVGKQTTINVVLVEDIQSLNEVVVNAGYWEVREKEQTGNISRIDAKEIQKQPVSNPLQAMQGRMTGVYIQQNTGVPGGGFTIQIRGQNSLRNGTNGTSNGNQPLYLIDGVPFTSYSLTSQFTSSNNLRGGNPLSSINPSDIESIEVLKDADATAIYGSRGSNGVVLITTKKAASGKAKISFDIYQGVGQVAHEMDLLNTPQYLTMRKEAVDNDGNTPLLEDPNYDIYWPDLKMWDTTRYTNWQKELIGGTANITNAQFTTSGGTARTQFLLGGGYYRETTVFPGENSYQRGSGKISFNHVSDDNKFRISALVNYSASFSNIPSADYTSLAIKLAPNAPSMLNEDGTINWAEDTWINPMVYGERKYESNIENFVGHASFAYEVLRGLNVESTFGYTSMQVQETSTDPLSAYSPLYLSWGITGSSNFGNGSIKTWIVEPQLDYTRKISEGQFSALIGTTFQESVQSGRLIQATGYTSDAFLQNIAAATDINVADVSHSQYKYAALFARLNYNWKEKYIINLTGRRDGSSRFGPGNQFANFGAVGAAWIFSNEKFVSDFLPFLSFGKLRTSYGSTGSDAIGDYQYLDTYSATTYPYNNSTGLTLTRLANLDYSWETNKKFESGLELGFIEDRISLSTSYYLNNSSGQLVGLPLPVMTGQSSVQFNLPAVVQNSGWEFQLNTANVRSDNFLWTTNLNLTIPRNKLVEFPDLQNFPAYVNRYEVGKPVFIVKGYQFIGVDPTTGLYSFADLNSDGAISSPWDLIGLKSVTQSLFGGLGNSIKYKNFQFDFLFQFVKQTGNNYFRSFGFAGDLSNQPVEVMDRWQQPGDNTTIQRFTAFDPDGSVVRAYGRNRSSDNAISDASFVRLKNISLSWQFPDTWLQKVKLGSGRMYVQGQNILTFTDYIGLDPENQTSLSLPPLRTFTVGIQLTL